MTCRTSGAISTASSRYWRTWSATRSSSRPLQGRITVGAAPRDGEVLFWVADTGSGISPDGLPHVFDRFWQARKGARQGAGLGLPITRGIVEAHGGRIWVESTLGRGSVFFFTVPEAPSADARPVRDDALNAKPRSLADRSSMASFSACTELR